MDKSASNTVLQVTVAVLIFVLIFLGVFGLVALDAGDGIAPETSEDEDDTDEDESEDEDDTDEEDTDESEPVPETDEFENRINDTESIPPPPYDISLRADPTPGVEIRATIESAETGEFAPHVAVFVNSNFVGYADSDGEIEFTVPYAEEMRVRAEDPREDGENQRSLQLGCECSSTLGGGAPIPSASGAPILSTADVTTFDTSDDTTITATDSAPVGVTTLQTEENDSTAVFAISTEIEINTDTVPLPGEDLNATFFVDEQPAPNMIVEMEGEEVGVTDQDGHAELTIPEQLGQGQEIAIVVYRGEIEKEFTLVLGEVSVDVDAGSLAIPGSTVDVAVTAHNETIETPLENASITVYDRSNVPVRELKTDENGTASFDLPFSSAVTIAVSAGGETSEIQQSVIYHRLVGAAGVVFLGLLVGMIGAIFLGRRHGVLREVLIGGVVRIASVVTVPKYGAKDTFGGWQETLRGLLSRLLVTPRKKIRTVVSPGKSDGGESTPGEATTPSGSPSGSANDRIQRYWAWFVEQFAGSGGHSTKTAKEIEQEAVDKGVPERVAAPIRKAFQAVEYGGKDASDELEEMENAVGELEGEQ